MTYYHSNNNINSEYENRKCKLCDRYFYGKKNENICASCQFVICMKSYKVKTTK